ncbi:MAG: pitrilysin family protein [Prochlorococcaceae cyanobacterium]
MSGAISACLNQLGGLPIWTIPRQGPAIVSARLWIRGGSSEDARGERGAAQLLAGLLSRGCGSFSGDDLADRVEGCGAGLRCEASEDNLLLSLKCASEDAAALLPLLITMVADPWLAPDQVALERQLNLQTLQRQREDPFQLAHDGLRRQLYGDGPYGHDPLGLEPELAALGPEQLRPRAKQQGSAGAVLVVAGQPPEQFEALLAETISQHHWSCRAPEAKPGPGSQSGDCFQAIEQDTEQMVLLLGCPSAALGEADGLALRLLSSHLGIGMSSRLFVALREEQGLAYDVGVHYPARLGAAPFVFHMSSSAERSGEATGELLDEWLRLLEQPLSPDELGLAQAKFRGQEAMGRQTCGQIADRLALVLGHGLSPDFVDDSLAAAFQLSPTDLQLAARRKLAAPCLCVCGPPEALRSAERIWRRHPLSQGR